MRGVRVYIYESNCRSIYLVSDTNGGRDNSSFSHTFPFPLPRRGRKAPETPLQRNRGTIVYTKVNRSGSGRWGEWRHEKDPMIYYSIL